MSERRTPMRILHVAPLLWSGAGQAITALCESQRAHHAVHITTSGASKGERDWPAYRRRMTKAGVGHTRIDFFDRDPDVFLAGVERLRALVESWRPDIVHTHAGVPALAAALVRDTVDRRFGFVSHVYSWGVGRPAWMDDMDLAGHRAADRVVCSAGAYVRRLRDGGVSADRLVCLPWGVTIDKTVPRGRRTRGHHVTGPRVGFVGRIEPRKGQLALVRGFAAARRRVPSATLEFVGPIADLDYARRLQMEIRRRGLTDAVRLHGHLPSTAATVASWDLFASLSSDEGQGLAILEAMALGVPVAARVVPGVEDYFEPGVNGIGVRSARPHDVANAIVQGTIASARLRACVRRGQSLVRRRYSWTATEQSIERLYRRVQGGAR